MEILQILENIKDSVFEYNPKHLEEPLRTGDRYMLKKRVELQRDTEFKKRKDTKKYLFVDIYFNKFLTQTLSKYRNKYMLSTNKDKYHNLFFNGISGARNYENVSSVTRGGYRAVELNCIIKDLVEENYKNLELHFVINRTTALDFDKNEIKILINKIKSLKIKKFVIYETADYDPGVKTTYQKFIEKLEESEIDAKHVLIVKEKDLHIINEDLMQFKKEQ